MSTKVYIFYSSVAVEKEFFEIRSMRNLLHVTTNFIPSAIYNGISVKFKNRKSAIGVLYDMNLQKTFEVVKIKIVKADTERKYRQSNSIEVDREEFKKEL